MCVDINLQMSQHFQSFGNQEIFETANLL